jgi:uncharacterized protein (TIGR01244 family)
MSDPVVQPVSADVCVSAQLEPSAMAWAAAQGFKSVVNNRPDFEGGPTQPTSAQIEEAAKAAGLAYAYLPVHPSIHSTEDIARMAELVAALPKPLLAFCRSGGRSTRLFQAAQQLQPPR